MAGGRRVLSTCLHRAHPPSSTSNTRPFSPGSLVATGQTSVRHCEDWYKQVAAPFALGVVYLTTDAMTSAGGSLLPGVQARRELILLPTSLRNGAGRVEAAEVDLHRAVLLHLQHVLEGVVKQDVRECVAM